MRFPTAPILFLAISLHSIGCGPSVWERSFLPEPGISASSARPASPASEVVVRSVPWDRVGPALAAEHQRLAESETHRTDWSADEARASEILILRALQLPIAAEGAELLGRSHFRTTQQPNPAGDELRRFAAGLGADYAIWSSRVLGKVDTVKHEAVRTDRWRSDRVWNDDRRRYEYVRRWEPETVWVPVVVERDEVRWVVFYVRRK